VARIPSWTPTPAPTLALKAMTQDEKLTVIFGYFGADMKPKYKRVADSLPARPAMSPASPRLGIPAQWETDAGVGVATQGGEPKACASAPPCPPASPPPPPGTPSWPSRAAR
jgi:hypothetical protein